MSDITREDIVREFPLREIMESYGVQLKNEGGKIMACCTFHDDKNPSMMVDSDHYHCFSCDAHGSVIDFVAHKQGKDPKETFKMLVKKLEGKQVTGKRQTPTKQTQAKESFSLVDTYPYRDEHGETRYFVDRLESTSGKKKFAQYTMDPNRKRRNGITGVERLLYRFPKVIKSDEVLLCEGEKCVHALESMGYVATTNSGGSGGWCAAYAEYLSNKDLVVIPDNDAPGKKWMESVKESVEGKVKTLRVIHLPEKYNDIADIADEMGVDKAVDVLMDVWERTAAVPRGVDLPILSHSEMEAKYAEFVRRDRDLCVNLGTWLPTLGEQTRPLYPGDVVTVIADTGTGKTMILQNIAKAIAPAPTLIFEIELTAELMAERSMSLANSLTAGEVEFEARRGNIPSLKSMKHVWTCVESKVDCEMIESIINRAELKMGVRPVVVMIDYIGLIRGGAGKRYERMSTIAEEIKVLAKATNTIILVSSQKKRGEEAEVNLHDPKDSGSIENSSALVLGAWKTEKHTMVIRILKQTKGSAGDDIYCDFNGATATIKEIIKP